MKRSILGVFLVLILLSAASATLALTTAETTAEAPPLKGPEDAGQLTHNIIQLALTTQRKAALTLDFAATYLTNDTLIATAKVNYAAGMSLLTQANATLHRVAPAPEGTWGDYALANQLALDAMRRFKAAMTQILQLWDDTDHEVNWHKLSAALQRAEDFVGRVTDLLDKIKQEYSTYLSYNFTALDAQLQDARQHLAWARANMTTLRINTTVSKLGSAKQSLDQIAAEVKKVGELIPIQGRRINLFIDEPIKKLIQRIEVLAKVLKKDVSRQVAAVMDALRAAEDSANAGDLTGAMAAIQDAHRMLMTLTNVVYLKHSPPR